MNAATIDLIAKALDVAFGIYANHTGKPEGWVPTDQDKVDLLNLVDEATPEHEKAEARKRLGLPEPA